VCVCARALWSMRCVHALRVAISHTHRVRTQFRNPSRASAAPRKRPGMRQRAKNDLTTTSRQPPRAPRPSGAYDWGIDAPATRLCRQRVAVSLVSAPIGFAFNMHNSLLAVENKKKAEKSHTTCCSRWCPWEKLGRWVNTTALKVGAACRHCMTCRLHVGAVCRCCMSAHALSRCADMRSKLAALSPVCPACLQGGSGRAPFSWPAPGARPKSGRARARGAAHPGRLRDNPRRHAWAAGVGLLKNRALIGAEHMFQTGSEADAELLCSSTRTCL
jgi:hypothetical protein